MIMNDKDWKQLGFEKVKTPNWIGEFRTGFIPHEMYMKPPAEMQIWSSDMIRDTFYAFYDENGHFEIYKESRGGFAGMHVQIPVFVGKSLYSKQEYEARFMELFDTLMRVGAC